MFNFFRQLCNNGVKMTVGQYHNNSQLLHVEFERDNIKMNCVVDLSRIENYTGDFNERLIGILTQYLFDFLMQSKRAPEPLLKEAGLIKETESPTHKKTKPKDKNRGGEGSWSNPPRFNSLDEMALYYK